jgi:FMN phosphatase YigB (HAD superfamily)
MIKHIFSDLFDVLIFSKSFFNEIDQTKFLELPNNLILNKELLDFYLFLKKQQNISLNIFTSAFFTKNDSLIKDYLPEFDEIYTTVTLGHSKRKKESFIKLSEQLSIEPNKCFFIDDKIKNTDAAKSANFNSTQYLSNKQIIEELKRICQL